jgi:hypothetical protein
MPIYFTARRVLDEYRSREERTKTKHIVIVLLVLLMLSSAPLSAPVKAASWPNLPPAQVQLTAISGTTSYFISTLSGVPTGFDVHNGVYHGWCTDRSTTMARGVSHNVILYSSLSPPPALGSINWIAINYILNHKQGTMTDVQNAIWNFTDGISPGNAATKAMIDAAKANPTYDPTTGAILAIICIPQNHENTQNSIIELTIDQPCTRMRTLINGNLTWAFAEPVDGYCEDFHVTVHITNVTDMYAYEFKVTWNFNYINLVNWTVASNIWAAQAIIFNGTTAIDTYKQAVTALPPSTGVNGDFQLVDLVFHIQNDVCPNMPTVGPSPFNLVDAKVSNSCSGTIQLCTPVIATWTFKPVQPDAWISPADERNSIVGDKFTLSVLLKNTVKMTDFAVEIGWNQYLHTAVDCHLTGLWSTLLTTDKDSVILNTDLFNASTAVITVHGPVCGNYSATNTIGDVYVTADTVGVPPMLFNGTHPSTTIWLFNVTFTKCDPWYCGAQPFYTATTDHDWRLENASTPIFFCQFLISSACGDIVPVYTDALYTFVPVPGDLDGSGHVDIADLMIEASYYGKTVSCVITDAPIDSPPNAFTWFYDLNRDGVIDIYDIVIVAKNLCRTVP